MTTHVVQGCPDPGCRAAIRPRQSKEAAAMVTGQGPVTITDVARLAGVSPGTASKALNGRAGISAGTATTPYPCERVP